MTTTSFENKVGILAHLFLHYADEDNLKDFVEYNDLGLPFAYGVQTKMITLEPTGKAFVEEAFDLLISALGIEDTGFDSWDDIEEVLSN
jgi:hypothetical protein